MKSVKFILAMACFCVTALAYLDRFGIWPKSRTEEMIWHRYKARFHID